MTFLCFVRVQLKGGQMQFFPIIALIWRNAYTVRMHVELIVLFFGYRTISIYDEKNSVWKFESMITIEKKMFQLSAYR